MKKYSELRTMFSEDLRILCIKNRWYTCGDCLEYEKLLSMPLGKNITTTKIVAMAENIYEHSENVDFVDICNNLLQICRTQIVLK